VYQAGTATGEDIIAFQRQCEEIIGTFDRPKRLKWKKMPYYFFFVTEERAIIVTPVGLRKIHEEIVAQIEDGKENDVDHINYILSTLQHTSSRRVDCEVNTLGFETSDQRVVQTLWALFDEYYSENGVDMPTNRIIPAATPAPAATANTPPAPPSANDDINVEVHKFQNNTNVLVEVSRSIRVNVNVQ
jgi:hypothetical protein